MFIHNFFVDLMISVRSLFDKYIFSFTNNYIKRYEFSVGNRPFQLGKEYNPNFEFPSVIVNLGQDIYPYSVRVGTIKFMTSPDNVHKTLVLYNKSNLTAVHIQEEMSIVPIDITINCESLLQAKEIEHTIKKFLPQDKYVQFLNFVSFLEVPYEFLHKCKFNLVEHEIDNLYIRFNKNLDSVDYCFAVNYKPLIKLDSISTAGTDSSQRSFTLALSISYLIQIPEYIICENEGFIEKINVHYYKFGFEPIMNYPLQKIRKKLYYDENDNKYIIRNLIFFDEKSPQVYFTPEKVFFTVTFVKSEFELTDDMTFSFITTDCERFESDFDTILNKEDNKVTFIFDINDWQKNFKISLTSPAILQIWKFR